MGLTDAAIGGKCALGASSGSAAGLSSALSVLLASVIGSSWLGLAQPTIARITARNVRQMRFELRLIDNPLFIVDISRKLSHTCYPTFPISESRGLTTPNNFAIKFKLLRSNTSGKIFPLTWIWQSGGSNQEEKRLRPTFPISKCSSQDSLWPELCQGAERPRPHLLFRTYADFEFPGRCPNKSRVWLPFRPCRTYPPARPASLPT